MADTSKPKLILAGVLAALGLFLGGRAWLGSSSNTARPAEVPLPESPALTQAKQRVAEIVLDTRPTSETVKQVLEQASLSASKAASGLRLGSGSITNASDLAEAFRERLSAVIDPDFARDSSFRTKRGSKPDSKLRTEEDRQGWEASAAYSRFSSLGLNQLEARVIYAKGKRIPPTHEAESYLTLTSTLTGDARFDISDDPEKEKLDVVEIRLPMEVNKAPPSGGGKTQAFVGFQFGWNAKRNQWVPISATIYYADNKAYCAIPFQ